MSNFFQEGNQLIIISSSGNVVWKGNPLNWSVAKVIEIPNLNRALILLDYFKWKKNRGLNLICVDNSGDIVWQAHEDRGQLIGEVISDIQLNNFSFFANTWNGNRLSIDEKTGQLTSLGFGK